MITSGPQSSGTESDRFIRVSETSVALGITTLIGIHLFFRATVHVAERMQA